MCCRKLFLLGLAIVVLTFAGGCAFFAGRAQGVARCSKSGRPKNKTFKLRVISYEEKGANVNGAYYVFESAPIGSHAWNQIVTFRHDDQPKIPTDQVRFVNDRIGYLFMGWVYAVTTDGGANWSVWDARKDLLNWQCCNYSLIRDVDIAENGSGVMLNPIQDRRGEVPELHTNDYGRHWRAE